LLNHSNVQIAPAAGKPGILVPGMGAVTATFIAGLEAIEPGLARPLGTLPQPGAVRPGKLTVGRRPAIRDFVPLASLACAAKT
jgi:myo-inositol-1-phosphate synthase